MSAAANSTAPAISVVVNTRNEAKNIRNCLRSVQSFAAEMIVVDMHSEDTTREIAESLGARVFLHEPLGFVEPARAFAVAQTQHEWVLILDADELVPRALFERLARIAASGEADVVYVGRENYMFGDVVAHGSWGATQDRHPRFFKKGCLELSPRIHRQPAVVPGARALKLDGLAGEYLIHFNYVDLHQFIEKLNRYTDVEAKQALERGESKSHSQALRAAWDFWYFTYVKRQGYRDGWRGFYLALAMGFYRLATAAKLTELREVGVSAKVEARYQAIADRIAEEYRGLRPSR